LIAPLFFCSQRFNPATFQQLGNFTTLREYIKAFGIGLVAVSFTYGGYQQTINFEPR
jgi:APA family basic amino acid/polyamine antiporter